MEARDPRTGAHHPEELQERLPEEAWTPFCLAVLSTVSLVFFLVPGRGWDAHRAGPWIRSVRIPRKNSRLWRILHSS